MAITQVVRVLPVAVRVPHIVQTRLLIQVADVLVHHVVLHVLLIAEIPPIIQEDVQVLLVAQTVVPTAAQVATKRVQETVQITVEMDVLPIVVKVVQQPAKLDVVANVTGLVVAHVINNALLDV